MHVKSPDEIVAPGSFRPASQSVTQQDLRQPPPHEQDEASSLARIQRTRFHRSKQFGIWQNGTAGQNLPENSKYSGRNARWLKFTCRSVSMVSLGPVPLSLRACV